MIAKMELVLNQLLVYLYTDRTDSEWTIQE